MFSELFNLVKNSTDAEILNTGFSLENKTMPYVTVVPTSIHLHTEYSTEEILLEYNFRFRVYAENRKIAKKIGRKLIETIRNYTNDTISNTLISRICSLELKPQISVYEFNVDAYVQFFKATLYTTLTGSGNDIYAALFDLYKNSQLSYYLALSDFTLETQKYPYIVLTSIEENSTIDRTCESVFESDFELVVLSETFKELEKISFEMIALYHNAAINCTEYNVEEFAFGLMVFNEVFPQVWQANIFFDVTRTL